MKTLNTFLKETLSPVFSMFDIFEAADSKTKFEHSTNNFNELLSKNPKLNANKNPDAVETLIEELVTIANYRPEEMFIYAIGANNFKIPYEFYEAICLVSNNPKYTSIFKFKDKSNITKRKIEVSFINGGLVFETGNGSIGKVSTEQQETATCIVWNAYVNALREHSSFDTSDKSFIKGLVAELAANFDDAWISNFGKQCVAITKYLESIGCDPKDYKMCRYGENAAKNKVSHAYSKFIKNYTTEIGGQKDNFDPSDVLIYLESEADNLISLLNSYAADPVNCKKSYLTDVFEKKLLQGLSLKKIAGNKDGRYSKYNTGDQNEARIGDVTSYEVSKRSNSNQYIIWVEGNFRFDDITDSEGEEVKSTSSVTITLRSFGEPGPGMDICINEKKAPTLGKCPARIWREICGLPLRTTSPLAQCTSAMKNFMENNNEELIKQKLKHIIAAAVKEGPACFPFILLH